MMKPLSEFRFPVLTGRLTQEAFVAVMLLALCLLSNSATAQNLLMGTNFCAKTSKDALASCQDGAQSDFSLALGKCDNLSDAAVRSDCRKQALADKKDALKTCNDEFDVRQTACKKLGPAPYDPVIESVNFPDSTTIDNPFFPLKPCQSWIPA